MAQMRPESFKRIDKNRNTIHEPVHTTYTVFIRLLSICNEMVFRYKTVCF